MSRIEELQSTPIEKWTESMVSSWLASLGINDNYIKTLHEEEVNGKVLLKITEAFLKNKIGMRSGSVFLIIESRNELVKAQKVQKQQKNTSKRGAENTDQVASLNPDLPKSSKSQEEEQAKQDAITRKRDSKPRPFGKLGTDHTYVKHDVLPPETGGSDFITPCHEYKSLNKAVTLDRQRLQAKLAYEVLKFATGCMNMRTNGTIHFGVMDSRGGSGCVHGEIIGIPITERDMYTDALDYINKCFKRDGELVRRCVRPPEFILVSERHSEEQHFVVEFDVESSVSTVRKKVFSVRLPKFSETANKIEYEKETIYQRVGAKTEPVEDINRFYEGVDDRDTRREEAENSHSVTSLELCQDLGRKLHKLITSGKKQIEKEKWYILVTNRFSEEDRKHVDFLLNMKLFCVLDFDPDSKVSGLCHEYDKHHAVNLHFMQNYKIPSDKNIRDLESHLHLFEQTSWIFCNGRNDFSGNETPCDENTWCKTRRTFLKDCVSLICKDILPKGTFLVIFLLTSPVETPLLKTFEEFFTDMQGHEDIICITESERNFQKWQAFALGFCEEESFNNSSVVGLKMSHVNATVQQIQGPSTHVNKLLPVYSKAKCHLLRRDEETMSSLEILGSSECEDRAVDITSKKEEIERDFYRGGKVTWENFWLAEVGEVGDMIQRDVYQEVIGLLEDSLKGSSDQMPVKCMNIYHYAGSGGSTVARQVLWKYRKALRCAVVKTSNIGTVSKHAVMLREYEEKDQHKCLPVLLLVDDCEKEYLEELKHELETAVNTKKIARGILCFILLSCRRCHNPEKMSTESPLLSVSVTHKLSSAEKRQFTGKRKKLEQQFQPEFILTFVLMSEEFEPEYVKKFVQHLLQDIHLTSGETQLIRYVALLNTYVENSFISQSHCEALLNLQLSLSGERFRRHAFENSLSEQAKLVFIHLRDERTHINSIRIIHQAVAKEILHQLLGDKQQSELAQEFLRNDVLFNHRFGGEEYRKFLRELFKRRYKTRRGDKSDTFFSPLIEHVRQNEKPEKAIELLHEAYKRFNEDAFFAQQLARLFYFHEKFGEAELWAETAAKKMPKNSYILDTRGQVYRRWFTRKYNAIEKKTPESTADAIETALKAIECFQKCQLVAVEETETMYNSGFFGVVDVGCSLLELMSSLDVFSNEAGGHSELQKYLLTEHIPKEIEAPWEHFHYKLKGLQPTMHKALEWISEELSYFQNLDTDEEETSKTSELTISRPKRWLVVKSSVYAKFFCEISTSGTPSNQKPNLATMSDFSKRMAIYQLGGGNITMIFSNLEQKKKDHNKTLEKIISLYPKSAKMDQMDFANYTASHFALSAISPGSTKLATLKDLQKLSQPFLQDKSKCPSSVLFLRTLLFWPEKFDNDKEKEDKYKIILTAVSFLQQTYKTKMKDIPARRRRIYTHFYLGKGSGYHKFVHKSKIETIRQFSSVSEKRQKWLEGGVWKTPEIAEELMRVNGWTEDGSVYLEGPKMEKFSIHPLHESSVPAGNENVTFYLGFTFRGPVACDITKRK